MKDKAIKLFGLLMTIALIAGLAGVSAMSAGGSCSAATSSLKWTPLTIPDGTHKQLYPGSDVGPMAVTSDGGTLFAAVNVSGNWSMLKSTDGGYTWRSTGFPTDATDIVAVKLSPSWSSDGTIYVATNNSVYKSKDRGNTFTNLSMSGVSGTITSLDAGVGADGKVKLVVGTSAEVYLFDDGVWTAQGVGAYNVLAVGFSPNYAADRAIVAVVNSSTETRVRTKIGDQAWGAIVNDAVIQDNTSYRACIGFPDDYNATSDSIAPVFVGLASDDPCGDVFRINSNFVGTPSTPKDMNVSGSNPSSVNVWSLAVKGTSSAVVILAGMESVTTNTSTNASVLVFASSNSGVSWSPMTASNKQPTGEFKATVAIADSAAFVGTRGNQSAVSIASSGAYTSWNQRGLIDTSIDTVTDMVVSADYFSDSTIYITTSDSAAASLWVTQTGGDTWERVFCSTLAVYPTTCIFDMVRVSADDIVLAKSGSMSIRASTDGGAIFDFPVTARENITAFAVEAAGVYYTGSASGRVYKTATRGRDAWPVVSNDSEISDTEAIVDLVLVGNDSIYAGTDGGGVYNASTSDLAFIPVGSDAPGVAGDIVKVAPDPYEEDYLYAGITGRAGTRGIWRCYLGDSEAEWEQIADGATVGNISSLACAEDNGILYAISSTDGIGYRCVRPTSTKEAPVFESFGAGLDTGEKVKSGLKIISGSNLLFAIGGAGGAYNKIWTSSDEIIKMRLLSPANGAIAGDVWENGSHAGKALVALSWEKVTSADSYEVQIASDADFITVLNSSCFASGSPYTANQMISANLWLGSEYYWRVRVVAPYQSQWSDNWSFTTPLGPKASLPELLSPAAGQSNVPLRPVLQWNNSLAATSYELVLTENCNSSNTVLNLVGDKKLGAVTAYQVPFDLKPGTSYCWKVRGLSDVTGSQWSDTGTFTTMAASVVAKESGTPAWVWIIIALSAVLIGAVVVLVVRTRRPI